MNIETIRQRQLSSERYSFREHAAGSWSLEHIHAQGAERLNRAEQWEEWLRLHRKALTAFDDEHQKLFWSASDREHYLRAMADSLRGYLRLDKETAA